MAVRANQRSGLVALYFFRNASQRLALDSRTKQNADMLVHINSGQKFWEVSLFQWRGGSAVADCLCLTNQTVSEEHGKFVGDFRRQFADSIIPQASTTLDSALSRRHTLSCRAAAHTSSSQVQGHVRHPARADQRLLQRGGFCTAIETGPLIADRRVRPPPGFQQQVCSSCRSGRS